MKKSIIGGRYYLLDGSYSSCLSSPKKEAPRCAPMNGFELTPLEVITDPFEMQPHNRTSGKLPFILTKGEDGHIYCVMYEERGLISKQNTFDALDEYATNRRRLNFMV